jgi:hypothetical protein
MNTKHQVRGHSIRPSGLTDLSSDATRDISAALRAHIDRIAIVLIIITGVTEGQMLSKLNRPSMVMLPTETTCFHHSLPTAHSLPFRLFDRHPESHVTNIPRRVEQVVLACASAH